MSLREDFENKTGTILIESNYIIFNSTDIKISTEKDYIKYLESIVEQLQLVIEAVEKYNTVYKNYDSNLTTFHEITDSLTNLRNTYDKFKEQIK